MARRRYGKPSPAISTAGAAAQPRDPAGDTSLDQPLTPRQEYGKSEPEGAAEPSPHFATGLGDQLRQQQQSAEQAQLEAYISHFFPGALPHERASLRNNHVWLANPGLVHAAGRIALERGIPRQSPEFLQAIGALIDQHHAAMQAQAAPPPAPPMPPPMPPMTHVDISKTENADTGEGEQESVAVHHVSAPVSRGDSGHSIEPQLTPSQIKLSPEERELCAINKIDEVKYAEGKLRLAKQKAAKLRD